MTPNHPANAASASQNEIAPCHENGPDLKKPTKPVGMKEIAIQRL
jgi:hypothetical protein